MSAGPLFEHVPPAERFSGVTYEPDKDCSRLSRQLQAVFEATATGKWFTLAALAERAGCSEASASARLRDLRKEKFGAHVIERKRVGDSLFLYRRAPKV